MKRAIDSISSTVNDELQPSDVPPPEKMQRVETASNDVATTTTTTTGNDNNVPPSAEIIPETSAQVKNEQQQTPQLSNETGAQSLVTVDPKSEQPNVATGSTQLPQMSLNP
jgi:hypothetical protein